MQPVLRAVGYQLDEPYVRLSSMCWSFNCPKPGAEVEFLDVTLKVMNATATIIQIDADIDQSLEMVGNDSADLTLISARQTVDRMKLVDFTTPVGVVYYGYLLREIPEIKVADYILSIFDWDSLLILLMFGITVGSLIAVYSWIFNTRTKSISNWIIVSCAGLIRQFQFRVSLPICSLILIGFWLWCCQIIITYYEAKLKSFLLLSHHRGTIFNTLDGVLDAVETKGWTMVIQDRGYTPFLWCSSNQCDRLNRLKSKILHIGANENIEKFVGRDKFVGFTALSSDMAQSDLSYFSYQDKILFVRDRFVAPEYLSFAVNKNVKGLRKRFNRAVTITNGAYTTIRARYMPAFPNYYATTIQTQSVTTLTTTHFIQLYQFCLLVSALAILTLLLELLVFRITRHFACFGHVFTYRLTDFEWRFTRPKWQHFPRHNTIVLPIRRSYSPTRRRFYSVG